MKISTKCNKILIFTLELININEQFPAPGTILQVPMPSPRAKKRANAWGMPGGGWAILKLTDAI
jgi:hypothetical protein